MSKYRFLVLCCFAFVTICLLGIQHTAATPTRLNPKPLLAFPLEQVQYRYYSITGKTANELRSQMLQYGPLDSLEGRRYDAETQWAVHWSYQHQKTGKQCAIAAIRGKVTITFVLPQWQRSRNVSPSLVTNWQRYLSALQTHENGHKNHGTAAAKEVLRTLASLPAYPSCRALEAAIKEATQAVIKTYNQYDLTYDRQTRHGITQGAVFPPITIAQELASQE